MQTDYRELLTRLRCDANLIRSSAFSGVRDAGQRMVALIDNALAEASTERTAIAKTVRIDTLSNRVLVAEIGKRMRAVRDTQKMCSRCNRSPVRARDLCQRCYKKAYRRGEIPTDK